MKSTIKKWIIALSPLGFCLALWGFYIEPSSIRVNEYHLALEGWPKALSGTRIVFLTDLHVGSPYRGVEHTKEILALANEQHPDLIVLGGDYMINAVVGGQRVPFETVGQLLATLKAPYGVWGVMGNHDWWNDYNVGVHALTANGVRLLEDSAEKIRIRGHALWLVGISDYNVGPHKVDTALAAIHDTSLPRIAVTHSPDVFPEIPDSVLLTFAGHTHGGQVKIPIINWRPIVNSKYGQRYAIGHVHEGKKHLFVSPGIGTSMLPVRFLVPPEISVVILDAA